MTGSSESVPAMAETVVPLQAVDEVITERGVNGWMIQARRLITEHDPYLARHFPGATIYPGVFIFEIVRQAVSEGLGVNCEILSVCSARFLIPLRADDVLILEANATPRDRRTLMVTASATVEYELIPAARVELLVRACRAIDAAA